MEAVTDAQIAENELICTKLLGWYKCEHIGHIHGLFHIPGGKHEELPTFTTWAEAGLILDAMGREHHIDFGKNNHGEGRWFCAFENTENVPVGEDYGETGPLAIREAALDYVRRWK